jgi:hypothetical protein
MALLLFRRKHVMGSAKNSTNPNEDGAAATGPAGEGPAAPEPAAAGGAVDAAGRGRNNRDNNVNDAEDWLADGLEEAGYGYGV